MFCKQSRNLMFTKFLVAIIIKLTVIALPVSAQNQSQPTSYDPAIHIWTEGMTPQGNMHTHVVWGTLAIEEGSVVSIPIFGDTTNIQFQQTETGSITLSQDWRNTKRSPNGVRASSCGEDYYVDYYSVPRSKVFSNALRINTHNPIDWHLIKYRQQGRLHGRYYCYGDVCTISVCLSDSANEPWALKLCWN